MKNSEQKMPEFHATISYEPSEYSIKAKIVAGMALNGTGVEFSEKLPTEIIKSRKSDMIKGVDDLFGKEYTNPN